MYVTSGKVKCMMLVCNLNGEYITEIHSDLALVVSIALDPAK